MTYILSILGVCPLSIEMAHPLLTPVLISMLHSMSNHAEISDQSHADATCVGGMSYIIA